MSLVCILKSGKQKKKQSDKDKQIWLEEYARWFERNWKKLQLVHVQRINLVQLLVIIHLVKWWPACSFIHYFYSLLV